MERWSALDAGVLIAQPVIAFMSALALSVRVDNVPPFVGALSKDQGRGSTALLVVGLATGCVLTGLMWRRMRLGAAPMSRAAVVALSLAVVPWIAFVVAGGQFGGAGSSLAVDTCDLVRPDSSRGKRSRDRLHDRTTRRDRPDRPLSVACSDPAHCLAFGCHGTSPGPPPTARSTRHRTANGNVAPFRITRAESLTAPFGQNALTCPGSRTCYVLSTNAAQLAGLAKSTDGGLHWQPIALPFKQPEPLNSYSIPGLQAACMSENACVFAVPQGFA